MSWSSAIAYSAFSFAGTRRVLIDSCLTNLIFFSNGSFSTSSESRVANTYGTAVLKYKASM